MHSDATGRVLFLLSLFAILSVSNARSAPPAVFQLDNQHLTTVDGQVRFHLGDDPDGKFGWAQPECDDASWPLLRTSSNWATQGYPRYYGFAWYRFKLIVPANETSFAIGVPRILSSYQIFADGERIGKFGDLPPQPRIVNGYNQIFPLPSNNSSQPREISIAIRVWHTPTPASYLGGGIGSPPLAGNRELISNWKTSQNHEIFWELASSNILMLINMLAAATGLLLYFGRRNELEYLWFAIYEFLTGADHLRGDYRSFYVTSWAGNYLLGMFLSTASWIFFLFFVTRILQARKDRLYWIAIASVTCIGLATFAHVLGIIPYQFRYGIASIGMLPYFGCILTLLYRGTRRSIPDARLLLVPVAICYASWSLLLIYGTILVAGYPWITGYFRWFLELSSWPFPFSVQDVADLLMLVSIVAILPMRFARTRRDEQRFVSELEAAASVQQILVPTETPSIPGFHIQSVYRPYGQVGGDFFQIIPLVKGGTLIVIGDVSGKGMPAAMTVSLLVGAVLTLAHYTQSPGEILVAMNQRMFSRSNGGFTTCLVLRIDSDGSLIAANAGHIPPYLNGYELPVETSLPLGLSDQSAYAETTLNLAPYTQITLLTDGVVEAQNPSGELFGFDRTASISTQPAESIAHAAQQFGQEDDITVVTLSLVPVEIAE
jgi:hypothetical protein